MIDKVLMKDKAMKKNEWVCIILAAGIGTRMKSHLPKVLHKIAGKTILERALASISSLKFKKKLVVIGHGFDDARKLVPDDFQIIHQKPLLGTGHAVMRASTSLRGFKGNVLVLCADAVLLKRETLKKFIEKHSRGNYDGSILSGCVNDPTAYGRIIRDEGSGQVIKIVEEKEASAEQKKVHEINSGIYCFSWPRLERALKKIRIRKSKNEYYLTDTIEYMEKVNAFCVDDASEITGINSRKQLSASEKVLRLRKCDALMVKGVTIVDPETTYIDDDVQIGQDSVIYPCTVIEGKVKIGKSCEIGPFSHVRDGVILQDKVEIGNFVEVKKSHLARGVKAKHLTYLGDARIGDKVNVGAGTITANYDGVAKHLTVIGKKTFIGSGTILVAPVKVGNSAVTGAGTVITKGKNVPHNAVVVGVPARILRKKKGDS